LTAARHHLAEIKAQKHAPDIGRGSFTRRNT
jgi:hypothetical protein